MPAVISLAGDWDIYGRAELRRRLAPACTAETCIVDFTGFHCGDATFLDELIYMRKVRKAQGRGPCVFVIRPSDTMVRKILQVTQLIGVWPIFDSMDAAVAAVEQKTRHSDESKPALQ
jgi:anti-anti-sigma regulatory factor